MEKNETIITIKEYGKINIVLKKIMDEQKLTRNYLARAANTRFEVIDKWYKNEVDKIDADILARICFVLKCKANDIIEYQPEYEQKGKDE